MFTFFPSFTSSSVHISLLYDALSFYDDENDRVVFLRTTKWYRNNQTAFLADYRKVGIESEFVQTN